MNLLFQPFRIGPLEVKNRFVRSATFEGWGDGRGGVTEKALVYYRTLGRGEIGTIVTGTIYVRQDGKGGVSALGIDRDELIPGLHGLADAIKADGSRCLAAYYHDLPIRWYMNGLPRGRSAARLVGGKRSATRRNR